MKTLSPLKTPRHLPLLTAALLGLAALPAAFAAGTPPAAINALVRVLKPDMATVIGQALVTPGGGALATINVTQADAIAAANGRCAFNVRYDEVAGAAVKGSVNRLYANDTLVAINSAIDLQPGVLRSITTQPYLYAGANNLKIVVNADSATPSTGWVRINVAGDCKAPVVAPKPPPAPVLPPVTPGSAQWNALYNAWGYSNYAVTQLKGKGFGRYADIVTLNAALSKAVDARSIAAADCTALMAKWNALAAEPAFVAAMTAVVPAAGRR